MYSTTKGGMKMNCEICGVKMALYTQYSRVCTHCDMHLDEGYTEKEIKEIIKNKKVVK